MKKNAMAGIDLRDAFPPMPEECREALMRVARSLKEDEPMKRNSLRVVLIAALMIVATMAIAVAATQLGLKDLIDSNHALPDAAQQVLSATEQKTYAVGPVAMTLRETLADGRLVYVTWQAQPEKEKTGLVMSSDSDFQEAISDELAAYLNVEKGLNFCQAAQQAKLALYQVSAYLTVAPDMLQGEEMRAQVYGEDGSVLLVDMLQTNPAAVGERVTGRLTMNVWEIDPATGERRKDKKWTQEEEVSISVNGVMEEKTYAPEGESQLLGYTLQSVQAERTCAGVYLRAIFQATEEADPESMCDLYELEYQDAQGASFPGGISFSGSLDESSVWPTVVLESMLGLEKLPASLTLVDFVGGSAVTVK